MPRAVPTDDHLEQVRDQLRAEIREGREMLADLRREMKAARTLVPLLTDELFDAEVRKHVEALGEETQKAMGESVSRVVKTFDDLTAMLMGTARQSVRAGHLPLPVLAEYYAQLPRRVDAPKENPDG